MRLIMMLVLALSTTAFAARKPVMLHAPAKVAKVLGKELSKKYTLIALPDSLGPTPTAKEVRDVTTPTRAIAVIQVQAGSKYVTMQILSGHDGTPLDTVQFKLPKKKFKALPKAAAEALFAALAQGRAPPAEAKPAPEQQDPATSDAPKRDPDEQKVAASEPDEKASPSRDDDDDEKATELSGSAGERTPSELPALHTAVGFKGFSRSFAWAAGHSDALASYALPFASAVAFDAAWYPGAHFTNGFGGNIGAFFTGEVGIGLASRQDESRYGTRADRFRFGAQVRFPFGKKLLVDALAGYSTQTFSIAETSATTGSPRPNIPSVTYNGPRAAVGAKLVFVGTFTGELQAGFMYVYGKGELASQRYFPNTSGIAADAALALSVELVSNVRLRAAFDWTGYFLSTNADPMALVTASGASDHFLGGTLSLVWMM